jgi:uncharacterized protein (TIGR03067 family)
MKRIAGLLAVFVAVIVSPSVRGDAAADEWKKLAGTWKVDAATVNGDDSTALFKDTVLTLEEGKYKVTFAKTNDVGTITLDPAKNPKQMTIMGTDGPSKGKTLPAIYEVDGDTLKVCYATEGKDPPKEFKSTAESKTLLVTYKRGKK